MERYETAFIEISDFEEDVITASVERCSSGATCMSGGWTSWTIYYTDGTSENVRTDIGSKPPMCP
ncbi:MAG: hypothetical protein IJH87_01360 [Atopobiaceae bacterium]|nr:hypothetical protein [Atopobiaceae bacterium]